MADDKTERDSIGQCARHQNRKDGMVDMYAGLSPDDRIALVKMITDGHPGEDTGRWSQPPDEL